MRPALCFCLETVGPRITSRSPFRPSSKPGGPAPLLPALQGGLLWRLGPRPLWRRASDPEGWEWGALFYFKDFGATGAESIGRPVKLYCVENSGLLPCFFSAPPESPHIALIYGVLRFAGIKILSLSFHHFLELNLTYHSVWDSHR